MSTLTAQVDKLREKARLFEGYQNGEVSRMLRESADTIELLRDTLGGGKLTAEQVEKAIHDCSTYASYDGCTYYASGIRLQAIADELNAALGGGECEWTLKEEWPNRTGDDHVYGYETSCGARHTWWPDSLPNFCPTCGGKVQAVER